MKVEKFYTVAEISEMYDYANDMKKQLEAPEKIPFILKSILPQNYKNLLNLIKYIRENSEEGRNGQLIPMLLSYDLFKLGGDKKIILDNK